MQISNEFHSDKTTQKSGVWESCRVFRIINLAITLNNFKPVNEHLP